MLLFFSSVDILHAFSLLILREYLESMQVTGITDAVLSLRKCPFTLELCADRSAPHGLWVPATRGVVRTHFNEMMRGSAVIFKQCAGTGGCGWLSVCAGWAWVKILSSAGKYYSKYPQIFAIFV